jgi:radical SAM protein with 4Fe4S-binding SPASM domain
MATGQSSSAPWHVYVRIDMSFESFPYVIGWELTLACNLHCLHCASSAGQKRSGELSLRESLEICDQLPELFVQEVIFTGGEPLLNENWSGIAAKLGALGIETGLVTNGLLVTDQVVERMTGCGLRAVGLSLDGPEPLHDQLRCLPGAFNRTMSSIELLKKMGIGVTIITSVTGLNIGKLDEIYRVVLASGAWKWQLQPLFPLGRGKQEQELSLTMGQFLEIGKYIRSTRPKAKTAGLEIVPADSCGFCSSLDFPEMGWKGCGAGRFSCGIMSDGRIKGCLSWPDTEVEGDLRKESLWSIWFADKAFSRQRFLTMEDMKGDCARCDVALECGGGCQAMSLGATGMFHADPYCYRRIMQVSGVDLAT